MYTALLTVEAVISTTSGTLEVGKTYVIDTLEVGDDFSNVGYVSEGTPFVATGTTPTTWTNSTEVINNTDSAPTITELYNSTGETITWEYSYGNGYIGTFSSGILLANTTVILTGNGGNSNTAPTRFYRNSTTEIFTKNIHLSTVGTVWSIEVKIYN